MVIVLPIRKDEMPVLKDRRRISGVATGGSRWGRVPQPWQWKICQKSGEKREKIRKKEGKNREGSFTLPLLTGRAGYATVEDGFTVRRKWIGSISWSGLTSLKAVHLSEPILCLSSWIHTNIFYWFLTCSVSIFHAQFCFFRPENWNCAYEKAMKKYMRC